MTCRYWYNLSRYAARARCAITGEFCQNSTCPVDFGPWGAWRAVVGQMVERMEWIDDCDEWQVAWAISTYLRQWIRSDLDAVGWSP